MLLRGASAQLVRLDVLSSSIGAVEALVPRVTFVGSVRLGRLGFCGSMPGRAIIWLNLDVCGDAVVTPAA
jgi:hypothetical protein